MKQMRRKVGVVLGSALLFLLFVFCKQNPTLLNTIGTTVCERFSLPKDYIRKTPDKKSFGYFLQHTLLKPNEATVHFYNGQEKPNKVAAAILNIDVGTKDIQQCADAVMRLRAEYLFGTQQFNLLHFNFTNGFNASYLKWREGYRINVSGNKVNWVKTNKESVSYQSFKEYLQIVFTYAGTASLAKELKLINMNDLEIGDVFIKGGSPGHAVIVMDVAINSKTDKKLFMIAQSYMPAQDIHILVNYNNPTISPWYELNPTSEKISTPEWTFYSNQSMRF